MSTVIEKVLKKRGKVQEDFALVGVDWIMSHDNTTPLAIEAFEGFKDQSLKRDKIIIVFDHVSPPSHIDAADNQRRMKAFAKKHGIRIYEGEGVCHTLMVERGFAKPWGILAGGDSHTPVYGVVGAIGIGMGSTDIAACWKTGQTWLEVPGTLRIEVVGKMPKGVYSKDVALKYVGELSSNGAQDQVIEFSGSTLAAMDKFERMPIGLMATECGAVTEVFQDSANKLVPDRGVDYTDSVTIEADQLEPLIACPNKPDNVKAISEVEGLEVDQVFIGSCTNGTLPDLRAAAKILGGKRVKPYLRAIVAPATIDIYREAQSEGLIETFLSSGVMVTMPPGCGPCLGRHLGVLGKGDVCVSTSNRNYQGRMGSPEGSIYLASPATAAATAVEGKIADPRRYL